MPNEALLDDKSSSNSQHITSLNQIKQVLYIRNKRYNSRVIYNSSLSNSQIKKHIKLTVEVKNLLNPAANKLKLRTSGYFKTIKIAQTIADLTGEDLTTPEHVAEALRYRKITT